MFARATDLAVMFRQYQIPVLIGGFHVSGMIKLFDSLTPDLQFLVDKGISLVCGEVEGPGVLAGILNDAINNQLKPCYIIHESQIISNAPVSNSRPQLFEEFHAAYVHN